MVAQGTAAETEVWMFAIQESHSQQTRFLHRYQRLIPEKSMPAGRDLIPRKVW